MRRLWKGPRGLVGAAVLILLALLASDLPPVGVRINDLVLHVSLVRGLETDRTLDFWHPTDLGYPVLRVYQPLFHIAVALLDGLTGGRPGPGWWAQVLGFLLGAALPLGVYLGLARWLRLEGFEEPRATWVAAIASFLAVFSVSFTNFGFDPMQALWCRYGVATQTWAMVFFAPAFAWSFAHLRGDRGALRPALLLAFLCWACSLIVGVMLGASIGLRALLEALVGRSAEPLRRLGRYVAGLLAVTAFLWWPLVADSPWVHYPARFFRTWVNEGFGQAKAFAILFSGRLFDGASPDALARPPVMSLLVLVGLVVVARGERGAQAARALRGARLFLLLGLLLWLSFFMGRGAWGDLLHVLPLLRSYQWGRFETLLQFWALPVAALGVWQVAGSLGASERRRPYAVLAALVLLAGLAWGPVRLALLNHAFISRIRAGTSDEHLAVILDRLAGEPARTYVGGPTTWEGEMRTGAARLGVALVEQGVQAAGRMYQGMSPAASLQYLWDGKEPWGAELMGIGSWLLPCRRSAEVPLLVAPEEVAPGVCLGIGLQAPPLAFYSRLAAEPPRVLTEERLLELQRDALASPRRDVFLPFRLGGRVEGAIPQTQGALEPLRATGHRMMRVARGRAESSLEVEVPARGAIVFGVPYHPRLEAEVDGQAVAPVPAVPGFPAVPVEPGRHQVRLVYRTDRVKDALFLVAVAVLAAMGLAERARSRGTRASEGRPRGARPRRGPVDPKAAGRVDHWRATGSKGGRQ